MTQAEIEFLQDLNNNSMVMLVEDHNIYFKLGELTLVQIDTNEKDKEFVNSSLYKVVKATCKHNIDYYNGMDRDESDYLNDEYLEALELLFEISSRH